MEEIIKEAIATMRSYLSGRTFLIFIIWSFFIAGITAYSLYSNNFDIKFAKSLWFFSSIMIIIGLFCFVCSLSVDLIKKDKSTKQIIAKLLKSNKPLCAQCGQMGSMTCKNCKDQSLWQPGII